MRDKAYVDGREEEQERRMQKDKFHGTIIRFKKRARMLKENCGPS
jgi:hypothetical protein